MLGSKKNKAFTNQHSLLSSATRVVGDIHFSGDFYVEGSIKGNIYAEEGKEAKLILHNNGFVEGDIHVPDVVINGRVRGTVYSSKHVELSAKAVVEGAIHYQLIEMVKGSQIIGQLVRSSPVKEKEPAVAAVKVKQAG